jgi:ATP-binding cassette, subfamily B, bacterial
MIRGLQHPSGQMRGITVRRTFSLFRPYRAKAAALIVLSLLSVTLELLPALTLGLLVGEAVNGIGGEEQVDLSKISLYFGLSVGMYSLSALLSIGVTYLNTAIGQGVMFDLRAAMHEHLNKLSVHFFTSTRTGEIMSRVSTDVNSVQEAISTSFTQFISSTATLGIALALMLYLDWRLAVIALSVLLIWLIPMWRVGQRMKGLQRKWQEEAADMSVHLEETLSVSGIMMVRSFGRQEYERERFHAINVQLQRLAVRRIMATWWLYLATRLFGSISLAVVYWWGGQGIADGSLAIADVIAFALLTQRTFGPFSAMTRINTVMIASMALFQRIFEYLDTPVDQIEQPNAIALRDPVGVVEFDHVSFSYEIDGAPALRDLNFRLEPEQMTAIVGPSGAGKTTVTYMLQRFYDPQGGRVLLDGHDLRDLTFGSVSNAVGVVMQDSPLFFKSLRENIRYGRLDATDQEVDRAAAAAGLDELAESLPQGLDTLVGERGYRLSGGEKQRVSIARAILKDPPVLILDEATASLDSRLEARIREETEQLARGRTTLIVAHRLSTVVAADMILVMENGRIVERGKHQDLLSRGGLYSSLYVSQFADSEPPLLATLQQEQLQ